MVVNELDSLQPFYTQASADECGRSGDATMQMRQLQMDKKTAKRWLCARLGS